MAHQAARPGDKEGADRIDMKSAVISGAFEGYSKDEIDRFYTQNLCEVQSATKPKKGSFQITSVTSGSHVNRDDDPGDDSQDDLDDTHTYTEDNMSMDWSKNTDLDNDRGLIVEEESPLDEHHLHRPVPRTSDNAPQIKERSSTDNQSRFRVVKIVTHEPFKRGRWTCFDFLPDPNKPNPDVNLDLRDNKDHVVIAGSETSSAASSIHYVHGHDDPGKNPLAAQLVSTAVTSPVYFDDQSKLQHPVLNGHDNLGYDHHENTAVSAPEAFVPHNGVGGQAQQPPLGGYTAVQQPVHQTSMPPAQSSLQTHTAGQTAPHTVMPHALAAGLQAPSDKPVASVLSSPYSMAPGTANNGPFTDVSHSTPRAQGRAIGLEKAPPRTHRISIGGEELELSDDFGNAGDLLEQIAGIPGALASPTKENDGEDSGPNSVAIDNKIEQAMDLVKSHLMFAVREEVEVLKEQILELEESKRKLEFENSFLKSMSSAETLVALAQALQNQPPPHQTPAPGT